MTPLAAQGLDAVTGWFERFAAIATRGLPRMQIDAGPWFCHRALQADAGQLRLEGRSERYTAMVLIGAAAWQQSGGTRLELGASGDALATWRQPSPGDLGLMLWAQTERGDARAEATARLLLQRRAEVFDARADFPSMEMGFLLRGLAAGLAAGLPGMAEFAGETAEVLLDNQHRDSGLFSFARRVRRKDFLRTRRDTRLGSFASQVYPTMALSALATASGEARWLQAAERCADRIVSLQGPTGQWWWIYQQAKATPALRYPVYSVHQDAMGPMLLLAVALASRRPRRYDAAVRASLDWFDARGECRGSELIDTAGGMVWRAVQHDNPTTTGLLGLGKRELQRLGRAAWFGTSDRRELAPGFVCNECRPYHLGWILLAAAMWRQSLAGAHG
ncbi:MAG: hypothetical protein JNN13_16675 [Planctomycetes bacterium]|nr:hypothetical protein [Planctomycetota bacterium]